VEAKKDMMWRVYLVYALMSVFAISIITRILIINIGQGDMWKARAISLTMRSDTIEAVRGNIFDVNGSLLATSLPYYDVAIDALANPYSDNDFTQEADSLSTRMATLFPDRSKREYLRDLMRARKTEDRYLFLRKNVSFKDLQTMKTFPILRLGKYRGGFLYVQANKRERPFKWLAARTIGYDRTMGKPIGLEGAYDAELKGVVGRRLMRKIAGGVWMPVNVDNEIDPQDGDDMVSTIDINIQDVAEHALLTQLKANNASHGCAILMEVKTGEIKAIANLTRKDSSTYVEDFNYAIGESRDPGSTFKLMSLMAAMEDQLITINDTVNIGNGSVQYYDKVIKDSHHDPNQSRMSVRQVFEESSNVGTAKLIWRSYSKNPQKFVDRLYSFGLNTKLGLQIPGEGAPRIKSTKDKDWSGISLPQMAYGYELNITPLQILNFYNAVANNGRMVKPMMVKELRRHGQVIKTFPSEVLNPSICSARTIQQAKEMLEGVVQVGTAQNLKKSPFKIAGKTGTAQTLSVGSGKYEKIYQASFVGYFPAEDPQYSCIVVINAPSNGVYYAAAVAAPVFKEIADKVFATNLDIHREVNAGGAVVASGVMPVIHNGNRKEITTVAALFRIPITLPENTTSDWVTASGRSGSVTLASGIVEEQLKTGIVPNLSGLLAKDALFLLENNGIRVRLKGYGIVAKQSMIAGTKFSKDSQITLELL
jgi:cell division protein FtsI (penicillin-binding protein 3)